MALGIDDGALAGAAVEPGDQVTGGGRGAPGAPRSPPGRCAGRRSRSRACSCSSRLRRRTRGGDKDGRTRTGKCHLHMRSSAHAHHHWRQPRVSIPRLQGFHELANCPKLRFARSEARDLPIWLRFSKRKDFVTSKRKHGSEKAVSEDSAGVFPALGWGLATAALSFRCCS